jgi:hypothetical protein
MLGKLGIKQNSTHEKKLQNKRYETNFLKRVKQFKHLGKTLTSANYIHEKKKVREN